MKISGDLQALQLVGYMNCEPHAPFLGIPVDSFKFRIDRSRNWFHVRRSIRQHEWNFDKQSDGGG